MANLARPVTACALLLLVGCGAPPPAAGPPPKAAAAAPAPKCPSGAASQPSDARSKMTSLGDDVRRCFILGARPGETLRIEAEVAIAEDGSVRKAVLTNVPAGRDAARTCSEKALSAAKFATFCGDEVAVKWTYGIQ